MSVNTVYSIEIVPKGTDKLNALPNAINSVSSAVKAVNSSMDPLTKIIQLLDNTNKILTGIGKVGENSFNKLDSIASHSADSFKKTVDQAEKLQKGIEKVGDTGEKTKNKLSFFGKLGNFSHIFNNITAMASSVSGSIGSIFEEGMARETASVNFGTLLKAEGRDGKEFADTLRNTDVAALYGTSTVNQSAMKMMSFGFDSDTTLKTLQQLGDIAMGDKGKMDSLATAFGQISSAGKMSTEDFNQLRDAGFNPLVVMSETTGKSMAQLREEMERGQISPQMVADALKSATSEGGKFHGMLKNVMDNTLQGKMAAFQGKMDDIKAKLFELALPIVDKLIPVITKLTETIIPLAENVVAPLLTFIADNFDTILFLAECIGTVVVAVKIWTGAQWLLNIAMNANPIGVVIVAITALIGVVYIITNAYNKWGAAVTFLLGPLGMIINIVMTIKRYWNDIVQAFQADGIMAGLKRIGVMLLDVVLYPIQQLLSLLSNIPGLGGLAGEGAEAIANLRKNIGAIDPETEKKEEEKTDKPEGNGTQTELEAAVNQSTKGFTGLGGGSSAAKGIEKVATGGTRNTQITITLGNLVETIAFNGGFEENREQVESNITDSLLRVLYSAAYAVE